MFPISIFKWLRERVIPDINKSIVFNNGIPHGFKGSIPIGGHILPIWISGDKSFQNQVQNNLKKSINSLVINIMVPFFINFFTLFVWNIIIVLSRVISRNQKITENTNKKKHHNKIIKLILELMKKIELIINENKLNELIIGQGLISKKCHKLKKSFIIILIFIIVKWN